MKKSSRVPTPATFGFQLKKIRAAGGSGRWEADARACLAYTDFFMYDISCTWSFYIRYISYTDFLAYSLSGIWSFLYTVFLINGLFDIRFSHIRCL